MEVVEIAADQTGVYFKSHLSEGTSKIRGGDSSQCSGRMLLPPCRKTHCTGGPKMLSTDNFLTVPGDGGNLPMSPDILLTFEEQKDG